MKKVISEKEFKKIEELRRKWEIVPMYAKMKKGNEVKYASAMEGVYDLMKEGYEYVEF